jgi:hypothetical protein
MARDNLKFAGITAALDFVYVAVAFWLGKSQRAGGDEILQGNAMSVEGDVAAFGLGYGKEVSTNGGEIDDLRRRSTGIACRHFLRCVIEDAETDGQRHKNADELAHEVSLDLGPGSQQGCESEGVPKSTPKGKALPNDGTVGSLALSVRLVGEFPGKDVDRIEGKEDDLFAMRHSSTVHDDIGSWPAHSE